MESFQRSTSELIRLKIVAVLTAKNIFPKPLLKQKAKFLKQISININWGTTLLRRVRRVWLQRNLVALYRRKTKFPATTDVFRFVFYMNKMKDNLQYRLHISVVSCFKISIALCSGSRSDARNRLGHRVA